MVAPRSFWPALIALALAGCATAPELRTKADPPIDLASFGTYQWANAAPQAESALADRARAAVARRLGARGLAGAADGEIAIAVTLDAGLNKRVTDFGDAFFIPGYGVHPGIHVPGGFPRYDVQTYVEGDLDINIYDAHTQSLIWSGTATGPVDPDSDSDIDRLVEALLMRAGSAEQH